MRLDPSPSPHTHPNPIPNPHPHPNPNPNLHKPGDYLTMTDPFAPALLPERDASVGIDSALLVSLEAEGRARGLDAVRRGTTTNLTPGLAYAP